MAGFLFRLERADGSPAEPSTFEAAVVNWRPRDEIPLGPGRAQRVVHVRPAGEDELPVLVVEDVS